MVNMEQPNSTFQLLDYISLQAVRLQQFAMQIKVLQEEIKALKENNEQRNKPNS